jgi:hypothetical protein
MPDSMTAETTRRDGPAALCVCACSSARLHLEWPRRSSRLSRASLLQFTARHVSCLVARRHRTGRVQGSCRVDPDADKLTQRPPRRNVRCPPPTPNVRRERLRAVGHQNLDRAEGIQRGTSAFGPGNFQDLGAGLAALCGGHFQFRAAIEVLVPYGSHRLCG